MPDTPGISFVMGRRKMDQLLANVAEFMGPLLLGVVVTTLVEAITGKGWGLIVRQRFKRRAARQLAAIGSGAELIRRGDEALYVFQYVPAGWRHDAVHFNEMPKRDLRTELAKVPASVLDLDVDGVLAAIEAERQRLADHSIADWNGPSLGVEMVRTSTRTQVHERPVLVVSVTPSDHAAAQVCSNLWRTNFDANLVGLSRDGDELSSLIPGMVHAVGLNATLVTDDDQLVLVRRSVHASSGRGGWHISVNEGMQRSDTGVGHLPDPHVGLVRGAEEELGITIEPRYARFHTAMLDVRRYQFGLLGHIDLKGTGITAADIAGARIAGQSKDKQENRSIEMVPWKFEPVMQKLREPDWIAHGWLNLVLSASAAFPHKTAEFQGLLGEHRRRTTAGSRGAQPVQSI